jgi:hypothetical protein
MVLRRIYGPKKDEVMGGWRKLHNEEPRNSYCLPSIIRIVKSRRVRWAGHVAQNGGRIGTHVLLRGKPEGKRLLRRPRCRLTAGVEIFLQVTLKICSGACPLVTAAFS